MPGIETAFECTILFIFTFRFEIHDRDRVNSGMGVFVWPK